MRATGVEPASACAQWLLRPSRLPIPPRPHCFVLNLHLIAARINPYSGFLQGLSSGSGPPPKSVTAQLGTPRYPTMFPVSCRWRNMCTTANTATIIRNNNHEMTQTVCTHGWRSSRASDPISRTQKTIPGIHRRFHFGQFIKKSFKRTLSQQFGRFQQIGIP